MVFKSYFTEYNATKGLLYGLMVLFVLSFTAVAVLQPLLSPPDCHTRIVDGQMTFENALYAYNPCWLSRDKYLLYMTPEECDFCRRLLASVLGGAMIGWERREADRPAGIRTMCLVSLGSALFTINSAYAFVQGPMAWDASRIAAAIPSGVGFLGSALIFKSAEKDTETDAVSHVVHGLTTSAALWVSAAVGVACGGALYVPSAFCISLMIVLLRFGPRSTELAAANDVPDNDKEGEGEDDESELPDPTENHHAAMYREETPLLRRNLSDAEAVPSLAGDVPSEVSSAGFRRRRLNPSVRNTSRPQLGALM